MVDRSNTFDGSISLVFNSSLEGVKGVRFVLGGGDRVSVGPFSSV